MVPVAPRQPTVRAFYVKRSNIERWGAHPGCPACTQIVSGAKVTFAHTAACRDRIQEALKAEGDFRL
eukprot:6002684-Amphidinium_carterae.1